MRIAARGPRVTAAPSTSSASARSCPWRAASRALRNRTAHGAALGRPKGSQPASNSGVAALAQWPNLTVPMGDVNGLPLGLSFVGPKWSEATLLAYGYAYEQASKARKPPTAYKQPSPAN